MRSFVVQIARKAMNAAKVVTRGDLIFVATVQEEIGLKGMEYWLQHNPRPLAAADVRAILEAAL